MNLSTGLVMGLTSSLTGDTRTLITIPTAFSSEWTPDFNIYESGRSYTTDYVPVKPALGTVKWVDVVNGLDTNNGDTEVTAYKTLAMAAAQGANTYYIKSGDYFLPNGFTSIYEFIRDTSLIAVDGVGTVRIGMINRASEYTWTLTTNNTYVATYRATNVFATDINTVLDLTHTGDSIYKLLDGTTPVPTPMTERASQATLESGSGHAFFDPDSLLIYVKTHDGRVPDSNVLLINMNGLSWTTNQNIDIYVEGIEFWARRPMSFSNNIGQNQGSFVGYRSAFRYSRGLANLFFDGVGDTRLVECVASHSIDWDGFSYNNTASGVPAVQCRHLEVNCLSYRNGENSADQGSTAHDDDTLVIRLNGHLNNNRVGFEDTQSSLTLNYGVTATGNVEEGARVTSLAQFWLRNCTLTGNGISGINTSGGTYNDLGGNLI